MQVLSQRSDRHRVRPRRVTVRTTAGWRDADDGGSRPRPPVLPHDGLPEDAWIPFLGVRTGMVSTRDDVRPFSVEEQRRILTVGACLTCHEGESQVMRGSVGDFEAVVAGRRSVCLRPAWN